MSKSKENELFGYQDYLKYIDNYSEHVVPRSRRFIRPIRLKPLCGFVETLVNTKINRDGVDRIVTRIKSVPASEHYSQFDANDFRITTLLESGVNLRVTSIQVTPLQEIERIKAHLDVIQQNEIYLNSELSKKVVELANNSERADS